MTIKTIKILVAVLALGVVASSIIFAQNVTAQSTIAGKNTIKTTFPTFDSPEIKRGTEIVEQLSNDSISESDEAYLREELQQIQDAIKKDTDPELRQTILDKKSLVSDFISEKLQTKSADEVQRELPINGLYIDEGNNALVVNVDSMMYSDEVAKSVLAQVRAIVGNEIDVVVQPMAPMIPQCSQTGDCEPAQGGVKISTNVGPCSLGFKATYDGKTGFMTAGHCTNGGTGTGVGQPEYVFWDDIGTAYANSYQTNSNYDGLFVDANEVISDKVFLNIDISVAGFTSYGDGVTMEGYASKGVSGTVVSSSYDGWVGNVWMKDLAAANYVGQTGDSGGTVYGYTPSNNFKGTHIGWNGSFSAYSKQENASSQFPGIAWQFN